MRKVSQGSKNVRLGAYQEFLGCEIMRILKSELSNNPPISQASAEVFTMKVFSLQDIADLLASIEGATNKLTAISRIVTDVPVLLTLRELNNRAALYVVDCVALLQEGGLRQGEDLNTFVSLAEAFCAEIELLKDPRQP
jgi:hypothetical protein